MTLESIKKFILPEDIGKDTLKDVYAGLDSIAARLLYTREIREKFAIAEFMDKPMPSVEELLSLYDVKSAAKDIIESVKSGKKIIIHGDYDADGISAIAILWEFIYRDLAEHLELDIDIEPYIPDRADEGYGLTEESIQNIIEKGAELIITVDCGVRDKELIQKYKDKGIDFVITDHHQPPEDILDNLDYILVHPMYPGKEFKQQEISGATVAFIMVQALREAAGMELDLKKYNRGLDLVALSLITDIMPLKGLNRTLVYHGLEHINKGERLGLSELAKASKIDNGKINSYHLGFVLGPRINAAGRIGDPLNALRLLVTTDRTKAVKLARKLNSLNLERQDLTSSLLAEAKEQYEQNGDENLIFVQGEEWKDGIVGLVAGKLQEEFYLPTLVATVKREDDEIVEIRGSARSIKGFNITWAIEQCSEHLERYGGHEQAAGFSVKADQLEAFKKKLSMIARENIDKDMLTPTLRVDLLIDTDDITLDLINLLEQFEPFGYGNPKPNVMIPKVVVLEKMPLGKKRDEEGRPLHMKLRIKGGGFGISEVVMFGCPEDWEKINEDDVLDLIGSVDKNEWNNRTYVQFIVKEWRRAKL